MGKGRRGTTGKSLTTQWKPGQSGNPQGKQPENRRRALISRFFEDVHKSWVIMGPAALYAAAWQDPARYCAMVAGLMPKEVDINVKVTDQTNDAELERLIANGRRIIDDAEAPIDAEILQ